jgi:C4-dicarboxylate transporter DctM subunit
MDLIQFGAALTVNLSMAHLTPPVGVGLFLAAQLGGVSIGKAALWAIPFVLLEVLVVLLVTYIPAIALTLPAMVQ